MIVNSQHLSQPLATDRPFVYSYLIQRSTKSTAETWHLNCLRTCKYHQIILLSSLIGTINYSKWYSIFSIYFLIKFCLYVLLFGLESREYDRRDPSRWSRGTLYPQKLTRTSPTSGGHSVGIVRSRTEATEFLFMCIIVNFNAYLRKFPLAESSKRSSFPTFLLLLKVIAIILNRRQNI
jgi:hypothetical protein